MGPLGHVRGGGRTVLRHFVVAVLRSRRTESERLDRLWFDLTGGEGSGVSQDEVSLTSETGGWVSLVAHARRAR